MKTPKLKKIKDQVIVITGASSGIGLMTAKLVADKGARVVIASRNEEDLKRIADELNEKGQNVLPVVADVSRFEDVKRLQMKALAEFGRIDTWVNNAGVAVFGPLMDIPLAEARQLFDTNFWGYHYGCSVAIDAMKHQEGGAIISVGSEASSRAAPLLGFYSASKQAIQGYIEALRSEMQDENIPVSLTLIRPASVDTPIVDHATDHMRKGQPSLAKPTYHPQVVAEAILDCAEHPKRDVFIGGASKAMNIAEHIMPEFIDVLMRWRGISMEREGTTRPHRKELEGVLRAPAHEGEIRGDAKGYVMRSSLWTEASLHPASLFVSALGFGLASLLFGQKSKFSQ